MIKVQASQEMLDEMQQQTDLICFQIKAAQDHQKLYADSRRSDRSFELGDMVFVMVKPKHNSLSLGKYKNLSALYSGPYHITKKLSDQAYELQLPPILRYIMVFMLISSKDMCLMRIIF